MITTRLNIKNATCASCGAKVLKALDKAFGDKIESNFIYTEHAVLIEHPDTINANDLIKTIKDAGYKAEIENE